MPQMIRDLSVEWDPSCLSTPSPTSAATAKLPTPSRTYKANCIKRCLVKAAVRHHMRARNVDAGVFPLLFPFHKMCVKFGPAVALAEASALRLVAKTTSIPLPKVYSAFKHRNYSYIVMRNMPGLHIGDGWKERPESEKTNLLQQLRSHIDELRRISHPFPGAVAAADIGSLCEPRTYKGSLGYGPFANENDFHQFLRFGLQADYEIIQPDSWITKDEQEELKKLVRLQDEKSHKIVFTHGDLNTTNILVKDGKISALIDFEMSGFYPEYWEYTTAFNVNRFDSFWKEEVPKFLDAYPREEEMETIRRKHFGPRGFRGENYWW